MTQNISARRGMLIAGFSALALLVLIAAFDNQGTRSWRADRISADTGTGNSWTATPVGALSALDWRATPETGEPTRVFLGVLAGALLAVVLTFLLLMLVCRGVAATRGRWALFTGSWFATAVATGVALVAASGIAGAAFGSGDASTPFTHGDTYYKLLAMGMGFGLFAGWLVGLVAVIVYGVSEGADRPGDDDSYTPPSYDYGSAAPSGSDYSFSPTSPYSPSTPSGSSTPEYGGYESSPSAPTQIVPKIQPQPPQEDDPFGGGSGRSSY